MKIYIIKSTDGKETHYFPAWEYLYYTSRAYGSLASNHTFKHIETEKEVRFTKLENQYKLETVNSYKID